MALYTACTHGNVTRVRQLLEAGVDPNFSDSENRPLHAACKFGHVECARLLIEAGADVHATNSIGDAPLMIACCGGNAELVALLLEAGSRTQSSARVQSSASSGSDTGSDTDWGSVCLDTPTFAVSLTRALQAACFNAFPECVRLLLKAGANVHVKMDGGYGLLHWTCLGARDDVGAECVIARARAECMQLLLEAGADVNAVSNECKSPLWCAGFANLVECVGVLLAAGAVVFDAQRHVRDMGWEKCLRFVQVSLNHTLPSPRRRKFNFRHPMFAVFSRKKPIRDGALARQTECLRLFLAHGVSPNAMRDGVPILHRVLGCKPNMSPIAPNLASAQLLIDAGADVHATDKFGSTLLHYACTNRNKVLVRALLSWGLSPNVKDLCGETPMSLAFHRRCFSCLHELVQCPNVDLRNVGFYFPHSLSTSLRNPDKTLVLDVLFRAGMRVPFDGSEVVDHPRALRRLVSTHHLIDSSMMGSSHPWLFGC